jgi:hypothetical protein
LKGELVAKAVQELHAINRAAKATFVTITRLVSTPSLSLRPEIRENQVKAISGFGVPFGAAHGRRFLLLGEPRSYQPADTGSITLRDGESFCDF